MNAIRRYRWPVAAAIAAGLSLAATATMARDDGGIDDFYAEYQPLAYSPEVLPIFPTPLCNGEEIGRSPTFIAGDGLGNFGMIYLQINDTLESLYRLDQGAACLEPLEFSLPLDVELARGGTCSVVSTQELVPLPADGAVLHNLTGLDVSNRGCFVTYRVDLATGEREVILDSSVVGDPISSFNPSPYSSVLRRPIFTTINRLASLTPNGSLRFDTILRTGAAVPTPFCETATLAEFRARPAVSGARIMAAAEFDESSCGGSRTPGLLLATFDEAGGDWTIEGVEATEPGTGDAVLPSLIVGHPDTEMFLTNGVNQVDFLERLYSFDVSADAKAVAANPIEDLYADVGVEPGLLGTFRSVAPGYTASGQPVMLGVGSCRYRGASRESGCLIAIGPAPGDAGAQAGRRLARVVGWGRDLPGYLPGRFVNVRFAATSGINVLVNIDSFDVDLEFFGRSYHQLTLDGYRPAGIDGKRLYFGRALPSGKLRIDRVKPLNDRPLINPVKIDATARGFVIAERGDAETIVGVRESSVVADTYDAARELVTSRKYPKRVDTRALFSVGDFNGNGADEIGVAGFDDGGQTVVTIKDGRSGVDLVSWAFNARFRPEFAALLDDLNGNGVEEFAILGVDVDGLIRARIRDGLTGESLGKVDFGKGLRAVGFAVVPKRNGARRWLSVLTTNDAGKTTAITRSANNGSLIGRAPFGSQHVPVAFGTYVGSGEGATLVVAGVAPAGEHQVWLKDPATGETRARFSLPRRFTPTDVTEVRDYGGDGVNDLLVVGTDLSGAIQLRVADPLSGRTVRKFIVE